MCLLLQVCGWNIQLRPLFPLILHPTLQREIPSPAVLWELRKGEETMNSNMRKWIVGGFLLGAMAFVGAPNAQAQYRQNDRNRRDSQGTYDSRTGRQGYFRDYQREIRFLEERIRREKDELRADSRRFGRNSFQMRAAKERLKQEERDLKQLKKDMKRNQKNWRRGNGNGNYRY